MNTVPETLTYHSLDALRALSLPEIEALWELVPTERQRLYRAIYDRTRRDEGASGSDAREAYMVSQLLMRFADKALVPVGSYWVPTPQQIQQAAKTDVDFVPADTFQSAPRTKRPSPILLVAAAGCVLVFGFLLLRGLSGSGKNGAIRGTGVPTATATLARTYTPTPLALDAQDTIIRGGNGSSGSGAIYPVNLRVSINGADPPRIFVVQRRVISMAEWVYDDNPDVASDVVGLSVHPVLGIPWSEANATLFQEAAAGSRIAMQMNTGTTLQFVCTERRTINRGDTNVFAQDKPGLTLVLMGQPSTETAEPTADRLVLLADYVPGDESTLLGGLLPTLPAYTPTASPTLAERVDAQIIGITTQTGRLTVKVHLFNGRFAPLKIDDQSIWLIYGYSEQPEGPHIAADVQPVSLEPGQAADLTLVFAWHGEPFAMLGILGEYSYSMTLR